MQVGASFPTENRRQWVRERARREFEAARDERDPEQLEFLYRLGETQLETLQLQSQHLSRLFSLSQHQLANFTYEKRPEDGLD